MSTEDTKFKIISVATRLFSRYGFHKTSMDEIAKIARKAKGSLYYHFTSKEELFTAVVSKEIENLKSNLSLIINNDELSAEEKMKQYLIKRMEILNEVATYHETLKADFFEHFDFIDDLRKELDDWERIQIQNIIQQGVEEGIFMDPGDKMEMMLDVFLMIQKGLEIPFFLQDKYAKYSPYFYDLLNMLIKGLGK